MGKKETGKERKLKKEKKRKKTLVGDTKGMIENTSESARHRLTSCKDFQ